MSDDGSNTRSTVTEERSAGVVWAITIVMLIAVIAGLYFYLQSQSSDPAGTEAMVGTTKIAPVTAEKAGSAVDNSRVN
jgi:hypothetical protein